MAKDHISPDYPCDLRATKIMLKDLLRVIGDKTSFKREELVQIADLTENLHDEIKSATTTARRQHGKKQYRNAEAS